MRPSETARTPQWLPLLLLGLMMALAAWLILDAGAGTVFRGDDWDLLLDRREFTPDSFLQPHVSHLLALQVAVQNLIVALVGPEQLALRIALLLAALSVAGLLFVFARRRVGPWLALALTMPVLVLGAGSESLIWPTQLGAVMSLAFGIGSLLSAESSSPRATAATACLLMASILSSSYGLMFIGAVAVWFLAERRWRALWAPGAALVVWLIWQAYYGTENAGGSISDVLGFTVDAIAADFSAITGFGVTLDAQRIFGLVGVILVALLLLCLGWRGRLRWRPATAGISLLPVFAAVATGLARSEDGDPFANRYLYPGAVLVLLALAELFRGETMQRRLPAVAIAGVLLVFGAMAAANVKLLGDAEGYAKAQADRIRGRLLAIEAARSTIPRDLVLQPLEEMGNTTAGDYLEAVDEFGESSLAPGDLGELSQPGKQVADLTLIAARTLTLRTVSRPANGSCRAVQGLPSDGLEVPERGFVVVPDPGKQLGLSARLYADDFSGFFPVPLSRPTLVQALPPPPTLRKWRISLKGPGSTHLCRTTSS